MSVNENSKLQGNKFLEVEGDGSQEAVAQSILKKSTVKPNFHAVDKSSLFARLDSIMSKMAKDEENYDKLSKEERDKMNMEDYSDTENVVEFNLLAADDMQDSPVFKVFQLQSMLTESMEDDNSSDEESSETDSDEEDRDRSNKKKLIQELES